MDSDPPDLVRHFCEMSDEALIERCRPGVLTAGARAIAIRELGSRRLALPDPAADAAVAEEERADYPGDLQTVARYLNPTDAHIVCGCLVAAGVPAIVADANVVQANSLWTVALGGVRVLVPAPRLAEARDVIEALGRGEFALPDDEVRGP